MTAAEATPLTHSGTILIPGRCNYNSDDDSIRDDGSNYKIDDTAFLEGEQLTEWTKRVMVKMR
eukprot:1770821-Ditylum_brightwellii.AAC.1